MALFKGSYLAGAALWRAGNFGPPSPTLAWQQHSTMPPDPIAATNEAEDELRQQGLIDSHGPAGDLGGMLGIFAHAESEADLKYAPAPGREVRVLVALAGRSAARWIIDDDGIEIETIREGSALGSLVGALPEVPPAPGRPVSLRTEDLRAAASVAEDGLDAPERAALASLRRAGVRSDDARNAVNMLSGGRTLIGQIGVAAYTGRNRKRIRGQRIIEVIDTDNGRAVRYQVGAHTTIAPGEPGLVTRAISQLMDETRADARHA